MTFAKAYFRIVFTTLLTFGVIAFIALFRIYGIDTKFIIFLIVSCLITYSIVTMAIIDSVIGRPKEFILGEIYRSFEWHRIGGLGYYFVMGDETIFPHSKRKIYHATSIQVKNGNDLIYPSKDTDIPVIFRVIAKYKPLTESVRKEYPFYYIIEKA